jgi:prefoldin subunit 5
MTQETQDLAEAVKAYARSCVKLEAITDKLTTELDRIIKRYEDRYALLSELEPNNLTKN